MIVYTLCDTSHSLELLTADHCTRNGLATPSMHQEKIERSFKVWVVVGTERFELPRVYQTVEEGRERVAKQVLVRLQARGKGDVRADR